MKNASNNNKKNNKPRFDKPQSRTFTPPRISSRSGQFGKGRRSIPRSK